MSLACYTQRPPPPHRYPHLHLEQQHNTCVRLEETTLDKAGEEADGIRRRKKKKKKKKKELVFRYPEYHGYSACSSSLSEGFGKIQGDGRTFLDRFKSYFGSQISSQSLNEIHICRLQPKSATKVDFFHIFLSLIVSSRRHGLQMANEADEVLLGKRPR